MLGNLRKVKVKKVDGRGKRAFQHRMRNLYATSSLDLLTRESESWCVCGVIPRLWKVQRMANLYIRPLGIFMTFMRVSNPLYSGRHKAILCQKTTLRPLWHEGTFESLYAIFEYLHAHEGKEILSDQKEDLNIARASTFTKADFKMWNFYGQRNIWYSHGPHPPFIEERPSCRLRVVVSGLEVEVDDPAVDSTSHSVDFSMLNSKEKGIEYANHRLPIMSYHYRALNPIQKIPQDKITQTSQRAASIFIYFIFRVVSVSLGLHSTPPPQPSDPNLLNPPPIKALCSMPTDTITKSLKIRIPSCQAVGVGK
ncbi:uncharacterized protein BDR25DRAFT_397103 [Lindgomyces ingoldianus]|uniref:Uncharacterized protein n=1 Tax=Lindgomyces ingoldianus TaxID=673940 RepID=A0ACB6Q9S7_9PLEO|nr:uncharacterized protein BDR25DRAFT_397103 [Lindgomyces ingoldianus]KAF2463666.1 hypothetical protein BDR25DRAFT_397103 [Lindgomyces ingoldianus]